MLFLFQLYIIVGILISIGWFFGSIIFIKKRDIKGYDLVDAILMGVVIPVAVLWLIWGPVLLGLIVWFATSSGHYTITGDKNA